jgi:arylsulfatase A-like enzyme
MPSVILVVIDTLRHDHLSCYGYEKDTSPGLDRLAEEALLFERCYATSSYTQPSTVSLMSGLYPARHGAHETVKVSDEVVFLAEVLRDAGYSTAGFSANPNASPIFNMDQGFDHFGFTGNDLPREYPDIEVLLDQAREWLQKKPARPLFLYLQVMNVHGPYRAPSEYRERFLEEPHQTFEFQGPLWTDILRRSKLERRQDVTKEHLRDLRARYDGAIAYTDRSLSQFFAELRKQGVFDNALLVITSDHGEELFDHGGFGHGYTLHEEVLHVPLLIRPPLGEDGGRRIHDVVGLVDLPATLLDWLGLLPAEAAGRFGDGQSMLPALRGQSRESERLLFAQLKRKREGRSFAVRHWPFLLLDVEYTYDGKKDVLELYNLEEDVREQDDLAGRYAEQARILAELGRRGRQSLEEAAFATVAIDLDEDLLRQLEALGYTK